MGEVEVFDARACALGEGPVYDDRTSRVLWVDILGRRVLWREVNGTEVGEIRVPRHVGAAVPCQDGRLVICLPEGPALVGEKGTVHPLGTFAEADVAAGVAAPPGRGALRSNDAKADPVGRLWLGTMAYDETAGAGALYRLDPGTVAPRRVLGDVTVSNGLGWAVDGSTMYYIDSPTRRVDAFSYDISTGEIQDRRPFVEIDTGYPDGMCVDADGGIWVALWQGAAVLRYRADGHLDRVVPVPTPQVTSCAFAGQDFQTLIITTAARARPAGEPMAGLTYAYEPGDVVGRPVDRFAVGPVFNVPAGDGSARGEA